MHDQDFAEFAAFPQSPHLLDLRVITQVVADAIAKLGASRQGNEFFRFGNGCGEWLFAENMLSGL